MSAAAYAAHLNNTVVPALQATREEISRFEVDIVEYEQVARRLDALKGSTARAAPAELGAGVWVDTVVPDTSSITLDLGLDIHLDLSTPEAAEYATKRAGVLRKKRELAVKREERLKWEIEQFEGAVREAGARQESKD